MITGMEELAEKLITKIRFRNTDPKDVAHYLKQGHQKTYQKGSFVYQETDPVEAYYILTSGKIEIFKYTDKFNKKIFATITDPESFGLPELFVRNHIVNAQCLTDVKVVSISREVFMNTFFKNMAFLQDLVIMQSSIIADFQKTVSVETAEIKLVSFLNYQSVKFGTEKNGRIHIRKKITHEKISQILSLSRETVTRTINSLKDRGIIDLTQDEIIILDTDYIRDQTMTYDRMAGFYGSEQ